MLMLIFNESRLARVGGGCARLDYIRLILLVRLGQVRLAAYILIFNEYRLARVG